MKEVITGAAVRGTRIRYGKRSERSSRSSVRGAVRNEGLGLSSGIVRERRKTKKKE
jgi:hypothetical protein